MSKRKNQLTGPTYLTIARMLLSVLFLIFVLIPQAWSQMTALILFIIAAITDLIDGKWARRDKIVTD